MIVGTTASEVMLFDGFDPTPSIQTPLSDKLTYKVAACREILGLLTAKSGVCPAYTQIGLVNHHGDRPSDLN